MTDLPHYQLFVDGNWTAGSLGQVMHSINPATAESWASFDCASAKDVDAAVAGAKRALDDPAWRFTLAGGVRHQRSHHRIKGI